MFSFNEKTQQTWLKFVQHTLYACIYQFSHQEKNLYSSWETPTLTNKNKQRQVWWGTALISALKMPWQEELCEYKASLVTENNNSDDRQITEWLQFEEKNLSLKRGWGDKVFL